MYGGALPIARNRKSLKRKMTEVEYLDATPEFDAKVAKVSAPESHSPASDMIIPQLEAPEADDSEHEDAENVVEISSGNSSSYLSSDSSDLSEGTTNFIRQIDEKLQKDTKSVSNETDSANQPPFQHSSSYSVILQDIGKLSERRVEICNQLPTNHPFQPPIIEPLQMILPDPVGETVVPASEQVAASEPSALAPAPKQITKTPVKATKSVPQKIELVNQPEPVAETAVPESVQVIDSEQTVTVTESEPNQQQPEQPHQPSPNQTTISTPTPNQPENQHSPQKAIPEPVVETVVFESVQVTESEQTVAITVSEPIQTTTQPSSITITYDQPSSSSSIIQTLQQSPSPPNMLKSEFLDAELLAITSEVQRLVKQRRSPTLHLDYQEQWDSLQTRVSKLLSFLSQKCNKIHEAAAMHILSLVHCVEDQNPLLLANTPFFSSSEYFSRERRLLKQYRQSALKHHVEYKAREDELLQKQLALEAALKEKDALIARLMNQQPKP